MGEIAPGNIFLAQLDPTQGHKQQGLRPVMILSGEDFNISQMCIVCPLSTQIKKFFGNLILLPNKKNGLSQKSEVLVGQIRSIDTAQLKKFFGSISYEEREKVLQGLDYLLDRF